MSTLEVSNISDKTTSVPAGYVVNGSTKSRAAINQTGVVSVVESLNLSSVTDNGTGYTTINFASAFVTSSFTVTTGFQRAGSSDLVNTGFSRTTTLNKFEFYSGGSLADSALVSLSTEGDLA